MSEATAVAVKVEQPPAPINQPISIVQVAIERGASLDQLERLLQMERQVQADKDRRAFAAAISAAKAEIGPIAKRRTVDFTSKKEGAARTNYKYEDMALVAEIVDPVLARHGLSYRYRSKQDGGLLHVACVIAHRDGHEEETWLTAPRDESGNKNAIQSIASTATYLQRYTLKLALGLAAGPDTDGKAPPAKVETITAEQAKAIADLVEELDGSTDEFCRHFKIESVGDLPAAKHDAAMTAIRKRKEARS